MAPDSGLIQIVDAAVAEASRKAGRWLACRPGCTQCCIGPFPISQLDALRLRRGLEDLEADDAVRAARIRQRARRTIERMAAGFPGDPITGVLACDEASEERFEGFADEEVCPALDPETSLCDLYSARPLTCRMFGPAMRGPESDVAICELCFDGAREEEISDTAVVLDTEDLEAELEREAEKVSGLRGRTLVAYALHSPSAGLA
jgi:Fe-S-cluster containining protein